MDVIASAAFGTKIDSHNDPDNEFVSRVREVFLKMTYFRIMLAFCTPWWLIKWIPFFENPMKMDRDDFFRDVTRSVIKQRKETGRRYNDFLQILMDCADENAQSVNQEAFEDETDRFGSITNSALSPTAKYKTSGHKSFTLTLNRCTEWGPTQMSTPSSGRDSKVQPVLTIGKKACESSRKELPEKFSLS
ncbi:cytochrome P450 3A24 [Trichonephila inaurata madagascariensis]|uniref:Cytochrome P450 3A24 n=1 Tax=Trichonephila inaurata madagascariensis TaxID=2747483 RepID=A0A8X6YCU5_9ARAC|nr:cytochrome P450 3A24 [Trichonephila inaurata madagascariensis]